MIGALRRHTDRLSQTDTGTNRTVIVGTIIVAGALTAIAGINAALARRAESRNPPRGSFVQVNGINLHYLDVGDGPPIVLLHGNGSMVEDFKCSGLVEKLAENNRVIVFDRPGYGHSSEPHDSIRTPEAQGLLIAQALVKLGVEQLTILGHSWGTLVAIALARSGKVQPNGLILLSGYYFRTFRLDVAMGSVAAIPVLGRALCQTVIPLLARISWPLVMKNLFAPKSARSFSGFPREMIFRPSHLYSSAKETALLMPSVRGLAEKCRSIKAPITLLAGTSDHVVDSRQSLRLQRSVPGSEVEVIPVQGHMIHHTSIGRVLAAIERVRATGESETS